MAEQGSVEANGGEARNLVSRRSLLGGAGALGIGFTMGPLLSACSVKQGGGNGAKAVKIGYVTPQTGPLAAFGEADSFVIGALQPVLQAGVKIGMGTDAAVYPHGLNAHELAVYVRLGMTPLQAIQTATVNDADLLGWSDKVGSIEPGKWADIIAVDGDPLQGITVLQHVKFVMKGGQVLKNEYGK